MCSAVHNQSTASGVKMKTEQEERREAASVVWSFSPPSSSLKSPSPPPPSPLPESRSAPCALRPPLPTSDLRLKPLPLLLDTTYTNAAHFSPTHSLSCATQRLDHPPSGATLAPFHRRPSTASACLLAFLSARTAYTGSPAYKESAYTHTPTHTHARLCVHARTGSIVTAHLSNSA